MRSAPADMPPFAAFMFSHFQLFFLLVLLLSAFTLISSIGLLKRLNWARLCFIGVMVFGIVYQLGGLVIQFLMFSSMRERFSAAAAQVDRTWWFLRGHRCCQPDLRDGVLRAIRVDRAEADVPAIVEESDRRAVKARSPADSHGNPPVLQILGELGSSLAEMLAELGF